MQVFSAGAWGDRKSWSRETGARLCVGTWQEGFQGSVEIHCALLCVDDFCHLLG